MDTDKPPDPIVILTDEDKASGFVMPRHRSYKHRNCGTVTKFNQVLADQFAKDPECYLTAYCRSCGGHFVLKNKIGGKVLYAFEWPDGTDVGTRTENI